MKKKLLLASTVFMALNAAYAQEGVGIGKTLVPNPTAVLDAGSDTKGILIPRVNLLKEDDITTIQGGTYPESLLVYHKKGTGSVLESGFYFWLNNKWNALIARTGDKTSETITSLTISEDASKEIILTYTDENKAPNILNISTELQGNDKFTKYIKDLIGTTASGTDIIGGTGIKVDKVTNGIVNEYTISAKPGEIALGGDVSGNADNTSVDKIKGVTVIAAVEADDQLALVYDHAKQQWKAGKTKVDGTDIQNKASLTTDASIEVVSGGTDALLAATSLKVAGLGINDVHLAKDAVITDKIKDANVTPTKIAAGGNNTVLTTDAAGKVEWTNQSDIKPTGANLSTDASIAIVSGGTDALLAATSLKVADLGIKEGHLAADAVTTAKILDANVTTGKIAAGGNSTVLTTDATGNVAWTNQSDIKPTGANLSTDASIAIVSGGTDALLAATSLKVADLGINAGHLAADAVITDKIKDANVTPNKISAGGNNTVLRTSDKGIVAWEALEETAVAAGTGVTVTDSKNGNVKTYTVTAKPGEIALGGDVSGNADNTSVDKIKGVLVDGAVAGDDKKALIYDEATKTWKPGIPAMDGSNVVFKNDLKGNTVIKVTGGDKVVSKEVSLTINDKSIESLMIGDGEIQTLNIADANVTPTKIEQGGNSTVLTTDAAGKVAWTSQSDIKPTGANLTGDTSIDVGTGTGAVLTAASIKVADLGIDSKHLAKDAVITDKIKDANVTPTKIEGGTNNTILTTDAAGVVKWESKDNFKQKPLEIIATPVFANEIVDNKKVFIVKVKAGVTEGAVGYKYNSIIDPLPKIDNIEYILSAQVYDATNKLVVSSVVDPVITNGIVTFRFGSPGMYSTLPQGQDYKVVLKYVSTLPKD